MVCEILVAKNPTSKQFYGVCNTHNYYSFTCFPTEKEVYRYFHCDPKHHLFLIIEMPDYAEAAYSFTVDLTGLVHYLVREYEENYYGGSGPLGEEDFTVWEIISDKIKLPVIRAVNHSYRILDNCGDTMFFYVNLVITDQESNELAREIIAIDSAA